MQHLFLDDSIERHNIFQRYLDWRTSIGLGPQPADLCFTAEEAIALLNRSDYDSVWLDHDLGTDPIDGQTVARHMITLPANKLFGLQVIIHSTNIGAAEEMANILEEVGVKAQLISWPQLMDRFKKAGMK